MAKYYAVKVGKTPGIYMSWPDCEAQVKGYPGAKYKSFKTLAETEAYMNGQDTSKEATEEGLKLPEKYAFVDGSFNIATGVYGYGGFVVADGQKHVVQGCGTDEEMSAMRNVAGEISGAMAAVTKALELGLEKITIFFDYEGIRAWVVGDWKAKNNCTQNYVSFMKEKMQELDISFVHVKGHTGIPGNEEADQLAKEACGVE